MKEYKIRLEGDDPFTVKAEVRPTNDKEIYEGRIILPEGCGIPESYRECLENRPHFPIEFDFVGLVREESRNTQKVVVSTSIRHRTHSRDPIDRITTAVLLQYILQTRGM